MRLCHNIMIMELYFMRRNYISMIPCFSCGVSKPRTMIQHSWYLECSLLIQSTLALDCPFIGGGSLYGQLNSKYSQSFLMFYDWNNQNTRRPCQRASPPDCSELKNIKSYTPRGHDRPWLYEPAAQKQASP